MTLWFCWVVKEIKDRLTRAFSGGIILGMLGNTPYKYTLIKLDMSLFMAYQNSYQRWQQDLSWFIDHKICNSFVFFKQNYTCTHNNNRYPLKGLVNLKWKFGIKDNKPWHFDIGECLKRSYVILVDHNQNKTIFVRLWMEFSQPLCFFIYYRWHTGLPWRSKVWENYHWLIFALLVGYKRLKIGLWSRINTQGLLMMTTHSCSLLNKCSESVVLVACCY